MSEGDAPKKRGEELMKQLTSGRVTSVTFGIGRRCPHCGELPEAFRTSFERRVEELFISPSLSQHYTGGPGGEGIPYKPAPGCMSVPGRYPAVIVPRVLVGKVIKIDVQEAPAGAKEGGGGALARAPDSVEGGSNPPTAPAFPAGALDYKWMWEELGRKVLGKGDFPVCRGQAQTWMAEVEKDAQSAPDERETEIARMRGAIKEAFELLDEWSDNGSEVKARRILQEHLHDCRGCEHDSWDGELECHDCTLPEGEKCPRGFDDE
jgi:hypothetical protein